MKRVFTVILLLTFWMLLGGMAAAEMTAAKQYDENGNCVKEMYFEDGQPFFYNNSYYGLSRIFEDGKCISITYLDRNGKPMMNRSGYATVKRTYNSQNKVAVKMYFDVDGKPVKLSLGQYGDKHSYDENGKDVEITYIGIDGSPIVTNSGYTSIRREYGENGKISVEWFYGLNGEPMELRRGQYGTRLVYEGSKIKERIPIDKNGNAIFLLDQYLPQHPWLVMLGAVAVVGMCMFMPKHWRWVLLFAYLLFILYMTLYVREAREDAPVSFEIFRSVKNALNSKEGYASWAQIVHNILLFVPLGFIITTLQPHASTFRIIVTMAVCMLLSVAIELTQYITGLGWMEVDDAIWNGVGGCIGIGVAVVIRKIKKKAVSPSEA